jgi:hypothetical protein
MKTGSLCGVHPEQFHPLDPPPLTVVLQELVMLTLQMEHQLSDLERQQTLL